MKDIKGFEKQYALTKDGELWSYGNRSGANHSGKFIRCSIDKDGYRRVTLKKNKKKYHCRIARLMLQTFNPSSNTGLQANHIDGVKNNDRLSNLEWVTPSENIKHTYRILGNTQKGAKNRAFKVWGYVLDKKETIITNKAVSEWCKEMNVSSTGVYISMKNGTRAKKGKLKGYSFFRVGKKNNVNAREYRCLTK